jgi:dolichyl-phosphate-mannose--protein O-mannosyl transferase
MDIQQLYVTFTNPKVVTSMILLGICLGIVLSSLLRYFAWQWYMPTAFVGICLVVALVYMYWLDRQDFRAE